MAKKDEKDDEPQACGVPEFLKETQRFNARLAGFALKMKRCKQGQSSAFRKVIELKLNAAITQNILAKLDIPTQKYLEAAGMSEDGEQLIPLNGIDLRYGTSVVFRVFEFSTFRKDAKPIILKGGKNDDYRSICQITGVTCKDGAYFLTLVVTCSFDKLLWSWGPDVYGVEATFEIEPFQPELKFGAPPPADEKPAAQPASETSSVTGIEQALADGERLAKESAQ